MSRHLFVFRATHGYWGSEDSQAHGGVPEGTGPGGAVPLLARGGTGRMVGGGPKERLYLRTYRSTAIIIIIY